MSEMKPHAIVAEYETVDGIMGAAEKVRDAGYEHWDTHTPFPVHGLDQAMGIKTTKLPFIVMAAGLAGLLGGLLMQWWMNAVDYPYSISGKPLFSLPANIPVTFETTVLAAAITTFVAALAMNNLPRLHQPIFDYSKFKRATDDRFLLVIEHRNEGFDEDKTKALLADTGAASVERFDVPTEEAPMPKGFVLIGILVLSVTLIPFALAYAVRTSTSDSPRIHPISDMDWQPKYKAQSASPLFEDGRAMRGPIEGTIPWNGGQLNDDNPVHTGRDGADWIKTSPLAATPELMARGKERYTIYCSVCHGHDGVGNGIIAQRADQLEQAQWVPPLSLHTKNLLTMPDGHFFNVITNGVRTMRGYGAQITPEDRWAIVLYLRAIQRTQNAKIDDVPFEMREKLR